LDGVTYLVEKINLFFILNLMTWNKQLICCSVDQS
jgi:hypothetical protein